MKPKVLIIDDEPDIRELLEITLKRMDLLCFCAEDISSARNILRHESIDLCLTDMKLPDGDGVEFVNEIQKKFSAIPVAVITAHGSMDSAIQALKYGAFDFLTKPIDLQVLRTIVRNALNINDSNEQPKYKLVGESQCMIELKKTIQKISKSQAPVYINGESGTGKELVAQTIHAYSPRAKQPFIPINCGAIPDDLLESELFGHTKGSFTGAMSDKDGLFKVADGGTLFLDEVAELPQHMQVKLLRSIQEKTIRPIGAQKEINIDIRILSATNKDLQKMVNEGRFREDLFYRINVIAIKVPPLRERIEDVQLLVEHILQKISEKGESFCPKISKSVLRLLQQYSFPGNIRELENILERALAMSTSDIIDGSDLQLSQSNNTSNNQDSRGDLEATLVDVERQKILDALEKTRWNKTAAAKLLGISFRALRYRLNKLDIS